MKALIIAFSMYSRLPMPVFLWDEEDRKRAMWFFPLVGAVVGAAFLVSFLLFAGERMAGGFGGAVLTAVPLWVSGGIHMDGLLDTFDARASNGDRGRKLEILKDSHVGAFAVMGGGIYMILYYGACTRLLLRGALVTAAGFVLSRAICGLLVASLPGAREKGMLADFVKGSDTQETMWVMTVYIAAAAFLMFVCSPLRAVFALAASLSAGYYCRRVMLKEFGGITGDLAGYFTQVCELGIVLSQAVYECLIPQI
ncbi:MAG: adenosylcobinamide-GDP ribazoletransferase [Lachnospiraceae bacterium]|nr:adenosylcobinamide-GDP ribazoletransferase [Lachnospiraceae bacterium]